MPGSASAGERESDAVRSARQRILGELLDEVDGLAGSAVKTMRAEIPSYSEQDDERFFDDVLDQVTRHYRTKLSAFLEERAVTLQDISFVRGAATRRARSGFALEDYLNAFRVGQQVLWDATVACAGDRPVGREAALRLAGPQMRYVDFASTHAAHAYVEYAQHVVADADRERRDLLEQLLTGEMPAPGPLVGAAQRYGIGPETRMIVAVAVVAFGGADSAGPDAASAAFARSGLHEATTPWWSAARRSWRCRASGPTPTRSRCASGSRRSRSACGDEGMPLAIGISTVAAGVSELPVPIWRPAPRSSACRTGTAGSRHCRGLTPCLEYLARHADDTAQRLVDAAPAHLLGRRPCARGRAHRHHPEPSAESGTSTSGWRLSACRFTRTPPSTGWAGSRSGTGRNPRCVEDLLDLLVARLALEGSRDRVGPRSQTRAEASLCTRAGGQGAA